MLQMFHNGDCLLVCFIYSKNLEKKRIKKETNATKTTKVSDARIKQWASRITTSRSTSQRPVSAPVDTNNITIKISFFFLFSSYLCDHPTTTSMRNISKRRRSRRRKNTHILYYIRKKEPYRRALSYRWLSREKNERERARTNIVTNVLQKIN